MDIINIEEINNPKVIEITKIKNLDGDDFSSGTNVGSITIRL